VRNRLTDAERIADDEDEMRNACPTDPALPARPAWPA
jgi:hypothetical protein